MKFINRFKRKTALWYLSFAVLIVCVIMIITFFWHFHTGFSYDLDDWAGFGNYFGSITGLLAFLGVLYSLIQSNKATEEAKKEAARAEIKANIAADKAAMDAQRREDQATEEAIRREERDLFFKLIELYKEKSSAISYNDSEGITYTGLTAFEIYVNYLNNIIAAYSINDCIVRIDPSEWNLLKEYRELNDDNSKDDLGIIHKCKNVYQYRIGENAFFNISKDNVDFIQTQNYIRSKYKNEHYYWDNISTNIYDSERSVGIYKNYNLKVTPFEMYTPIRMAGNILNSKYGHKIGQYIRNMFYVLDTINNFKYNREYYNKLFRAQLSRKEVLFCLFVAVSDKSSRKFVTLLNDNNILDDLYFEDLFYTKEGDIWKDKELYFVRSIFVCYLNEDREEFIEKYDRS